MTTPTTPPPDWSALAKGMLAAGRAAAAAFEQITTAFRRLAELVESILAPGRGLTGVQLALARGRVGGNLTDTIDEPDLWRSVDCSAWLHLSCTSAVVQCTCPCHRSVSDTSAARAAEGRWPVLS